MPAAERAVGSGGGGKQEAPGHSRPGGTPDQMAPQLPALPLHAPAPPLLPLLPFGMTTSQRRPFPS